jgi:hypothetical protein
VKHYNILNANEKRYFRREKALKALKGQRSKEERQL